MGLAVTYGFTAGLAKLLTVKPLVLQEFTFFLLFLIILGFALL